MERHSAAQRDRGSQMRVDGQLNGQIVAHAQGEQSKCQGLQTVGTETLQQISWSPKNVCTQPTPSVVGREPTLAKSKEYRSQMPSQAICTMRCLRDEVLLTPGVLVLGPITP